MHVAVAVAIATQMLNQWCNQARAGPARTQAQSIAMSAGQSNGGLVTESGNSWAFNYSYICYRHFEWSKSSVSKQFFMLASYAPWLELFCTLG